MPRRALAVLVAGLVACCASACVPTPEERAPLAVERAAADLRCPESGLSSRYLGERLFEVRGCGRQATYRVICKITVHTCYLLGGPDDQPVQSTSTASKSR